MRKACWNAVLFIYFVILVIKGEVGGFLYLRWERSRGMDCDV